MALTKRDTKLLEQAILAATMQNANFYIDGKQSDEVKEAVRLYMSTWVICPLKTIIKNNTKQ
jgi:hypothetical protein